MFGRNLKYLRKKYGMGQLELAHKLDRKNISTISEWESGKYTPKLIVLAKIAHIFNISIDDLMDNDLESNPLRYPPKDKNANEILKKYNRLSLEGKQSVSSYIDFILSKENNQ